jgi:tetratricopeptide (TPR) repeat protein
MKKPGRRLRPAASWTAALLLAGWSLPAPAQEQKVDFNDRYRFPLSIGLEYQTLTPLRTYNGDYSIFELSADVRHPLPRWPVLQGFLRGGLLRFDSMDPAFPEKWDHSHWFGAVGLGYSNRFVKNFELGAELAAGFSEAVFPNVVDTGPVGSPNLLFSAGGKISLDPSYSLSIDIRPSLKYLLSLGPLKDFNGLLFGLGFGLNYRFGEDPDSAQSLIRSLRFSEVSVPPAFSAMQSHYVRNPIGQVVLTNTEKQPVSDLQVSFYQAGFMDSPTQSLTVPELAAGQSVTVPLLASFNQAVFTTEGVTPLTGEVIVAYRLRERPAEQRQSVTYDLYDKKAITWDDDRKVGAFITPADSAIRNYASFVRQLFKDSTLPLYNEPLQVAMQLFSALAEIGLLYQADPSSPFTRAQGDAKLVDSVSLPRDTLKTIAGDCDDLTVLFCSLLESVGIETAFITVPGHIYAALNTKVAAAGYRELHPERALTLGLDGELWVPVEITLIGTADFPEAWRRGMELWNAFAGQADQRRLYRTREAQALYRPVGLRESDLGLQYGNRANIAKGFARDLDKLAGLLVKDSADKARKSGDKLDYNRLGLAYVRFGKYEEAEAAFGKALQIDPGYLAARVNLGNVAFARKSYVLALKSYQGVQEALLKKGGQSKSLAQLVLLNMSKAYHEMENYPEAQKYYARAAELDPERAREFTYLAQVGASGTERAAAGGRGRSVSYVEEEEQ